MVGFANHSSLRWNAAAPTLWKRTSSARPTPSQNPERGLDRAYRSTRSWPSSSTIPSFGDALRGGKRVSAVK
jgi:hypothetical protein